MTSLKLEITSTMSVDESMGNEGIAWSSIDVFALLLLYRRFRSIAGYASAAHKISCPLCLMIQLYIPKLNRTVSKPNVAKVRKYLGLVSRILCCNTAPNFCRISSSTCLHLATRGERGW